MSPSGSRRTLLPRHTHTTGDSDGRKGLWCPQDSKVQIRMGAHAVNLLACVGVNYKVSAANASPCRPYSGGLAQQSHQCRSERAIKVLFVCTAACSAGQPRGKRGQEDRRSGLGRVEVGRGVGEAISGWPGGYRYQVERQGIDAMSTVITIIDHLKRVERLG